MYESDRLETCPAANRARHKFYARVVQLAGDNWFKPSTVSVRIRLRVPIAPADGQNLAFEAGIEEFDTLPGLKINSRWT